MEMILALEMPSAMTMFGRIPMTSYRGLDRLLRKIAVAV